MRWEIKGAKVMDVYNRQNNKTGEAYAGVKIAEIGASHDIRVNPAEVSRFAPFVGKVVSCGGEEIHEVQQFGREIKKSIIHHLDTMEETKSK